LEEVLGSERTFWFSSGELFFILQVLQTLAKFRQDFSWGGQMKILKASKHIKINNS
jgi:hypothetical protein